VILAGDRIVNELAAIPVARVEGPWDVAYFCPHVSWVEEYGRWWFANKIPNQVYKPEEWDCDDYARDFENEVKKQILGTGVVGATPAICKVKMQLSVSGNPFGIESGCHVSNLVRCADSGWRWWDAYSGKSVELGRDLGDVGIAILDFVLV